MYNNRYEKFSVIIPTYNEEGTIVTLMELLIKLYPGISIIIADDGSSDDTQKKVKGFMSQENHVFLLDRSNEKIKGLTASVLDGIKQTKTQNFIVMDGDLQHPPESIKLIIEKLSQDFDLVLAARDNIVRTWNLNRFVGEKVAAFLGQCRLLLKGIAVQDPMSGFFGGKTVYIKNLIEQNEKRFVKEGYKVLFDILKTSPPDAYLGGIRFEFSRRKFGRSKMNLRIVRLIIKSFLT